MRDRAGAEAFARRRVRAALIGGPRTAVDAEHPLRRAAAASAMAGIAYAAMALSATVHPTLPDGWSSNSVVVTASGARFVGIDGVLYPVVNGASARLLVPSSAYHVVSVPDDLIRGTPRGAAIGIVPGPEALPTPDHLVSRGWSSCVAPRGDQNVRVDPAAAPPPATGYSAVVRSSTGLVVVTGQRRMAVPAATATPVLRALGLDAVAPLDVPDAWVALFREAPPLVPLRLDASGGPAGPGLPPQARVGSVLVMAAASGPARRYLVAAPGRLSVLTPLAHTLYRLGVEATAGPDLVVRPDTIAGVPTATSPLVPVDWPDEVPRATLARPCAVLTGQAGGMPATSLALAPRSEVAQVRGAVAVGTGALVRAVTGDRLDQGTVLLLDETGTAYPLAQTDPETLARLGFSARDISPVPSAWVALFPTGPRLGVAEAAAPVRAPREVDPAGPASVASGSSG